jgi:putative oxidoreductase
MKAPLTREMRSELTLLLLRACVGVIFIVHGSMKLAAIGPTAMGFESLGVPAPEVAVYLAILGELVGGIGLTLGLLTPLAAMGPLLVMIFAIGYAHAGNGLLASNGGWEYPLTLILVNLVFLARGGGSYSLDAMLHRMPPPRARGEHVAAH